MSIETPAKIDIVFENVEFITTSDIIAFEMHDLKKLEFKDAIGQKSTMLVTPFAKITFKLSTINTSALFGENITPEYIIERLKFSDVACLDLYYPGQTTSTYVHMPWDEKDEYTNSSETVQIDEETDTVTLTFK